MRIDLRAVNIVKWLLFLLLFSYAAFIYFFDGDLSKVSEFLSSAIPGLSPALEEISNAPLISELFSYDFCPYVTPFSSILSTGGAEYVAVSGTPEFHLLCCVFHNGIYSEKLCDSYSLFKLKYNPEEEKYTLSTENGDEVSFTKDQLFVTYGQCVSKVSGFIYFDSALPFKEVCRALGGEPHEEEVEFPEENQGVSMGGSPSGKVRYCSVDDTEYYEFTFKDLCQDAGGSLVKIDDSHLGCAISMILPFPWNLFQGFLRQADEDTCKEWGGQYAAGECTFDISPGSFENLCKTKLKGTLKATADKLYCYSSGKGKVYVYVEGYDPTEQNFDKLCEENLKGITNVGFTGKSCGVATGKIPRWMCLLFFLVLPIVLVFLIIKDILNMTMLSERLKNMIAAFMALSAVITGAFAKFLWQLAMMTALSVSTTYITLMFFLIILNSILASFATTQRAYAAAKRAALEYTAGAFGGEKR